ncbi:response regulator transcription factor [Schaedlerella arabinosiphila]|uniref:Stage 0 sporulation protein A homolog n=1 Tax=Schaedlerella arabinosiphila TaxID=2044587 RepID=A0A9X5C526_9FIRM|nr:response regulator transcription factor [Schaedlerella arabinosiphila]MCI9602757.1 response regulator transcription factor [Ruminococcus sp.]MCI9633605.1 response regulator transcription factor [Ruminococcus sp.]NDO67693.1 response regulator transcription factor [Schaedlerella arabinosiphila]
MQKLLVVEDDRKLNRALCYALEKEGYGVVSSYSIEEAKRVYMQGGVRMVLLDVNLPDGEGFEFCRWVKAQAAVPVLFLTARDLEEDALNGYELGAEDYVTKPFSMKILLKKIDVILKRTETDGHLCFDDGFLKADFETAKTEAGGQECVLTPTEFRLLKQFVTNRGQLLTYEVLLERLWDSNGQFVDKHTLAVNVNRLRRKIEDEEHRYISNVYGMGYQWLG